MLFYFLLSFKRGKFNQLFPRILLLRQISLFPHSTNFWYERKCTFFTLTKVPFFSSLVLFSSRTERWWKKFPAGVQTAQRGEIDHLKGENREREPLSNQGKKLYSRLDLFTTLPQKYCSCSSAGSIGLFLRTVSPGLPTYWKTFSPWQLFCVAKTGKKGFCLLSKKVEKGTFFSTNEEKEGRKQLDFHGKIFSQSPILPSIL